METEYWIGRMRVGADAIFMIVAGLFMRWAAGEYSDLPALLVTYMANASIVLGCLSLAAWLTISLWRALR